MTKRIIVCALLGFAPAVASAQATDEPVPVVPGAPGATITVPVDLVPRDHVAPVTMSLVSPAKTDEPKKKHWYEKLSFRGYTQLRYSRAFDVQGAKVQILGDSAVAATQTFSIRRARLILSGDVSDYVSVYLQPDFAASVPGVADATFFAQIRDWYADVHFDRKKEFRVRLGQSKVPFGFENLQSSQNRIPLDRSDALNSAVKNERDLGAFFYWTPKFAQDFFKHAIDDGEKGSGNYGVLALGAYAGQGGSFREQNSSLHVVARAVAPLQFAGQKMEFAVGGYWGKYGVLSSAISPLGVGPAVKPAGTLDTGNKTGVVDTRAAVTVVVYPRPIGFQAEWNVGRGPTLNAAQTSVDAQRIHGGYAMLMYRWQACGGHEVIPFARYGYYRGGYKSERNAPNTELDDIEAGVEWQIAGEVELTVAYQHAKRTNTSAASTADTRSYEKTTAHVARTQVQIKF